MDKTQIKHIVHAISGVEIIINTEKVSFWSCGEMTVSLTIGWNLLEVKETLTTLVTGETKIDSLKVS